MPLNILNNHHLLEPIHNNLKEIEFGNKILNTLLSSISGNIMTFYVNIINNKIEPLETIVSLINNDKKININIKCHDKNGKNLFSYILYDFNFTKINNLLDFNYSKQDLMHLSVQFDFSELEYINHININAIRRQKVNKILNNENELVFLSKNKLNLY